MEYGIGKLLNHDVNEKSNFIGLSRNLSIALSKIVNLDVDINLIKKSKL